MSIKVMSVIVVFVSYCVFAAVIFKSFYSFVRCLSDSENRSWSISRNEKLIILISFACMEIIIFLSIFLQEIQSGASCWSGVRDGALACILPVFKVRNLILFGMLFFLLLQDRKLHENGHD